ncbi:MAG: 20S proteasome subunit A/B [Verrucomicrobia bacterium]|nr:20S proteasome subunit A/B [Verrucomicrobiota bacterium]
MIDEPFRWVEAIANRREYIENELITGSPTVGLTMPEGQLLLTFGRDRRKIFEIYDRIAMGAIGHPGDIERLRMTAIELASTEGFTRSAADVSLRRMANYSFSPALKQAFEQIYGPPYLARVLFVEVGETPESDLFIRLDYDGTMTASNMGIGSKRETFGVIAGTKRAAQQVENFLRAQPLPEALEAALDLAVRAWGIGRYCADEDHQELPDDETLHAFLGEQLVSYTAEAVLLERKARITFVPILPDNLEKVIGRYRP